MNPADNFKSRSTTLETYSWVLALAWTIIIGGLLGAGLWQTGQIQRQMARNEAIANFNKDLSLRFWVAAHGGVFSELGQGSTFKVILSDKDRRHTERL